MRSTNCAITPAPGILFHCNLRVGGPLRALALAAVCLKAAGIASAPPQYQIYDIGVVQIDDSASQGFGVSPRGMAVGRSLRNGGSQAFTWTQGGGIVYQNNALVRL